MNILITAPNLESKNNVSGISSIANIILKNRAHKYIHFCAGKKDRDNNALLWLITFILKLIQFPFVIIINHVDLLHLSVPFDKKGILRELIFALVGRIFGRKILAHFHGGIYYSNPPKKNRIMFKFITFFFRNCDHIIVLSEEEKRILVELFGCKRTISVIANSIEPIVSCEEIEEVISHKKKNSFIYIGRITKEKGMIELIEALRKISSENSAITFHLCGTGPEEDKTMSELNKLQNIEFKFEGIVFGKQKNDLLKESEFFILPSHFEGMPISLLEAMSAACVPISTDVGAVKHLIKNADYGYIVEPHNVESLYNGINQALKASDRIRNIAYNVWDKIQNEYNTESYFIILNEVYFSVLHSKN